MAFSIIILSYNTKQLLTDCLNSILGISHNENLEIIIVDNCSQDGSVDFLKRNFGKRIKIIENKVNKGFGVANNQGAREARGQYLFFVNSDTLLFDDIFGKAKRFFEHSPQTALVAPQLILENGEEQKYAYGGFPNFPNLILRKFSQEAKDKMVFEVDWVSGAAFFIKKNVFEKVKGFDANFFMYFEDIDLCKRVKDMGYQIAVNKNLKIAHLGGKSISAAWQRKKLYYRSQDFFCRKHYGLAAMLILKLIRLPYQALVYAFSPKESLK